MSGGDGGRAERPRMPVVLRVARRQGKRGVFAIWGRELDATRIGDQVAATGEAVDAFVDGAPWTGDPRAIELLDHRAIELQLGPTPEEPLSYSLPPEY